MILLACVQALPPGRAGLAGRSSSQGASVSSGICRNRPQELLLLQVLGLYILNEPLHRPMPCSTRSLARLGTAISDVPSLAAAPARPAGIPLAPILLEVVPVTTTGFSKPWPRPSESSQLLRTAGLSE